MKSTISIEDLTEQQNGNFSIETELCGRYGSGFKKSLRVETNWIRSTVRFNVYQNGSLILSEDSLLVAVAKYNELGVINEQ